MEGFGNLLVGEGQASSAQAAEEMNRRTLAAFEKLIDAKVAEMTARTEVLRAQAGKIRAEIRAGILENEEVTELRARVEKLEAIQEEPE